MSNLPDQVGGQELDRVTGNGLARKEPRVVVFGSQSAGAGLFAKFAEESLRAHGFSVLGLTHATYVHNVDEVFWRGRRSDFAQVAAEENRSITPGDVDVLGLFGIAVGAHVTVGEVAGGDLRLGETAAPDIVFAFSEMRVDDGYSQGPYPTPYGQISKLCDDNGVPFVYVDVVREEGLRGKIVQFVGKLAGSEEPLSLPQPTHPSY